MQVKLIIGKSILKMTSFETWATLLVFFFFAACQSKNENGQIERIKVDPSKIRIEKIEDIIVVSDTVFLETTATSLIGSIVSLSIFEDKIFIKSFPSKLSIFSESGEFLGNIGTKGQAGFEYISLDDFFIYNDTVFIWDFNGKKILKYETNGTYIGNTKIEQSLSQICPLPNDKGYIVLNALNNSKDNPKFGWMDYDFKIKHFSREQRLNSASYSNSFFQNGSYVDYWEMFNNTIYSVTEYSVTPKYFVDFGRYAVPRDIACIIHKAA